MAGACRREELCMLLTDDIHDVGSALIIKIRESKTKIERKFTVINDEENSLNFVEIYRKYADLRPNHCPNKRFFLSYRNGKCSTQPVGKNSFGSFPSKIAQFLKLPEAQSYTGHCFRRTSATMLADKGGDILSLKRLGGWKSSKVAESYVDDSESNRIEIAKKVLVGEVSKPSTCTSTTTNTLSTEGIKIENCINCNITLNINKT